MNSEELYNNAEFEIMQMIKEADYPEGHPFLEYPQTPESMLIKMLVIILCYTENKAIIAEFVTKCNGKENGVYSFKKYREGISELIWCYYLIMGLMEEKSLKLISFEDENKVIINNGSKFEYSFCFDSPDCIVAFEVKSISTDPFDRELGKIKVIDGQKLIKPFFPVLKDSEFLKTQTDSIILTESTHYRQLKKNIKRINEKCIGENVTGKKVYIFATLFITTATSFEEFYSYFFNSEFGLYDMVKESEIDALVIASLDAKNDIKLNNLYENGYVQTIVPHPSDEILQLCRGMRMDNYIALGDNICDHIKELSEEQYGYYKVLNRRGILNIIPQSATEEEVNSYVEFILSDEV